MPLIPYSGGRSRQDICEFRDNLVYIVRPGLKKMFFNNFVMNRLCPSDSELLSCLCPVSVRAQKGLKISLQHILTSDFLLWFS